MVKNKQTNKQKNLLLKVNPDADDFTGEFCQTLKKKIITILGKVFQKIEEEAILLDRFSEATKTLISKWDKDIIWKRKDRLIFLPQEHKYKNSKQNFSNSNPTIKKWDNPSWPCEVKYISRKQDLFNIQEIV